MEAESRKISNRFVIHKVKYCPKCNAQQNVEKFDELFCPKCDLLFQYPIRWQNVKDHFYRRNDDYLINKEVKIEQYSKRQVIDIMTHSLMN